MPNSASVRKPAQSSESIHKKVLNSMKAGEFQPFHQLLQCSTEDFTAFEKDLRCARTGRNLSTHVWAWAWQKKTIHQQKPDISDMLPAEMMVWHLQKCYIWIPANIGDSNIPWQHESLMELNRWMCERIGYVFLGGSTHKSSMEGAHPGADIKHISVPRCYKHIS